MVFSRFYHDNIFVIKSRPITDNARPDSGFCIHYLFLPEIDPVCVGSVHLTQCCGKIEKNEMDGACGAYGGVESCAQGSGGET
jgi:hypothetical protein